MNFVLDCSFAMTWVFKDEATVFSSELRKTLGTGSKAFVPPLWRWEVANVILSAERCKRLAVAEASQHLLLSACLPIQIDDASIGQTWSTTHLLARAHKLTSYDASYLEVAIRRGLALATLDSSLRTAAKNEKVPLLPAKV
jgi:predicted nucleic acid-binding protein